jgi:hypothetical protein
MSLLQKKNHNAALLSNAHISFLGNTNAGLLGQTGRSGRPGSKGNVGIGGSSTTGQLVWSYPLWTKAS